jgi:hypothetical protein
MKRLFLLAILMGAPFSIGGAELSFLLPSFPAPSLVLNQFGEAKSIGFLSFLRQLQNGGVSGADDVDMVDESYAVLKSDSLTTLAAWLESACRCVGVDLTQARQGAYDGMVYARLLEVGTSLAELRAASRALAIPIGVVICRRRQAWGDIPGDGARDAYLLIATERGLLVYDPPTRQLAELSDFPNNSEVFKVQF